MIYGIKKFSQFPWGGPRPLLAPPCLRRWLPVVSLNVVAVAVEDELVAAAVVMVDGEGVGEAWDAAGEVGSP